VQTAANLAPDSTVGAARRQLTAAFAALQLDTPELDARLLVAHALRLDHAGLAGAADRVLSPAERQAIAALMQRRLGHEPVARIMGHKEFWGLDLRLTPATLVPRPETETIVEAALAFIDVAGPRSRPLAVADLGTGSGALLLALLSELPQARAIGTDISLSALAAARDNAERLGLAPRAAFVACSYAGALRGPFDLVVANPPYIAAGHIPSLPPEVRDYDPHAALDGGHDGLAAYRAIAADAARVLRPEGQLIVELGSGQDRLVEALLRQAGWSPQAPRNDLAGIPRALAARPVP
jgi:release factor glutamine methyltransferase